MFAAGRRKPPAASALPPPPQGFEVDPLESIRASGANITSGFRDPRRNRRVGGVPGSDHLNADALDLTPGKGQSWSDLHALASEVAKARGGKVIDESRTGKPHIHLSLPGWGGAPGLPPPPAGFQPSGAATPRPAPPTGPMVPSGKAHDGDTFGLTNGGNGRLLGVDAFELNQQGRTPSGAPIPLGQNAKGSILPFIGQGSTFTPNGTSTYGRPVGTVDNGGDAGRSLLRQGNALAAPQYLQADPARMAQYMEAERMARLNRLGAHGNTYQTPSSFRAGHPDPWEKAEASTDGKGTAVFADEPTPFTGLRPEIEQGYLEIWNNPASKADDLLAYARSNGFNISAKEVRQKYAQRFKDGDKPDSAVEYGQPPKLLTDLGDGRFGSAVRGFADPINMLDEMGGVADSLIPGAALDGERENVWNSDRRFGDILWNNIDQNRAILGNDEETHPYYRLGGQLASGVVAPIGGGARTIPQLVRLGAIEGGLAGFGAGEGNMLERAPNAAAGMALGAAGGAALGGAIQVAPGVWRAGQRLLGREAGAAGDDLGTVGQAAYEAAPVVDDGLQQAGPTPAARAQPQGGVIPSAAMRMEDGSPELVGRAPDYINVNDLPPPPEGFVAEAIGSVRPVGAMATADDMAALAGRVSPDDVLPLGQLAPDESAALGTREFAKAGGRSTYQRGPVDLVGFVRSMGGVADEGGELSHLGINNAARDMDFAKGEGFLGALVHGEGHSLDDMAEKAWDAGYFRERPTVPEFLEALADTHGGHNRLFHPSDLGEVAEHDALRDERYGIEQAIDEATPYSDLAAVGPRAGNIDLGKLETRGDIARALSNTETMFGGFDAARRGRISHKETEALADELGMTADQLLRRRQGQALNAEQALAARRILAKSGDELVALAMKAKGGSEADLATFRKAMLRHAAIQEQVTGATAEAGRALTQFKVAARSKAHGESVMRAIIQGAGGRDSIEDVAQHIIDLQQVPGALNKFAVDAVKPTWKDKAVELYYNSLLSGPQTHAVNIVSNALTSMLQVPEHFTAAAIGQLRRSSVDRVMGSELGPRIVGLMQGAMEGLRAARYTFKTGRVPDHVSKVEAAMQEAIPGKVGHVLRTPTRALSAEDEFFKGIARRSELAGLATRRANSEGLKGEARAKRIAELTRNPPDDMMAQALDYARYVTFQRPVGPVAGAVLHATQAQPWLKLILPFVRTPTNIIKFAAERSPLAPVLKEWRADFMAGGARRDLAIARMTLGTGLGMTIADLASKGDITGSGPADDNARQVMMADGWQPYSIRVGDKFYSYQRLDPLATTLGVAADYVQLQEQMTDTQREKVGMLVTASIIGNLSDKTWLSGLSDAVAAVHDPQRFGSGFINRIVGSAVPTGVAQVARTIDPTPREAKGPLDTLQSRIPGLSDDLRPRLDAWGRPILKEGGLGPDIISPVYRSTARNEPINQEALRLGLKVTEPSRKVGARRLSDDEFHAYKVRAGEIITSEFSKLVSSPEWQRLSDQQKAKRFEDLKKYGRQAAREALGLAHGGDGQEVAFPPPPPGFAVAE